MIGRSQPPEASGSHLPYTDTKPVGAPDFYFAINATFRFIEQRLGRDGLLRYWHDLGAAYFAPVTNAWAAGGLGAVADYWRAFFNAEPESDVSVKHDANEVTLTVRRCPAVHHLRAHGREIVPDFCEHCYWVSEAMGQPAGITVRVSGGNGTCQQKFLKSGSVPAQDLTKIARCS